MSPDQRSYKRVCFAPILENARIYQNRLIAFNNSLTWVFLFPHSKSIWPGSDIINLLSLLACLVWETLNIVSSVKRKVLSLEDKVNSINVLDKGKKKAKVFRKFGLVNSTVGSIYRNKGNILSAFEQSGKNAKWTRKQDKEDLYGHS